MGRAAGPSPREVDGAREEYEHLVGSLHAYQGEFESTDVGTITDRQIITVTCNFDPKLLCSLPKCGEVSGEV